MRLNVLLASWISGPHRLAGVLGIRPPELAPLLSGGSGPPLVTLVDACMQLGVDPVKLVRGDHLTGERSWPPREAAGLLPHGDAWRVPVELRERYSSNRYPDRARALDEFIADSEAVDFKRVLRHGGNFATQSFAFPLRYARAAELRRERVVRSRQLNSRRLNPLLDREIAAGAPRSISEVARSVGVRLGVLRYYSAERAARLAAMRRGSHTTRQPGLRDRVQTALVAALEVPEGPTVSEVMRSLGVKEFVALRLCPEHYRSLVDQRAREREERRERCVTAMREELGRRQPGGVGGVADRLGVSKTALRGADPQLYSALSGVRAARAAAARRRRERAAEARAVALRERRLRLAQALERELRSDSPRSARAVALECGVSMSVLAHHCGEAYRRLVELCKARRDGVH